MQFLKDLEYACKRDLTLGILDLRYGPCVALAESYYATVVIFQNGACSEAQKCQEKYASYVEDIIRNAQNPELVGTENVVKGLDPKRQALLFILHQYMTDNF
jgi:hypothetical protein